MVLIVYSFNHLTHVHQIPTMFLHCSSGWRQSGESQTRFLLSWNLCTWGRRQLHMCMHSKHENRKCYKRCKRKWYNKMTGERLLQTEWSGRISFKKWHCSWELHKTRTGPWDKIGVECSRKRRLAKALKLSEFIVMFERSKRLTYIGHESKS